MPCKSIKGDGVKLVASSRVLNLIHSNMPQHDGLYLATVIDGGKGEVHLSFDATSREDVHGMLTWYEDHFPNELIRL